MNNIDPNKNCHEYCRLAKCCRFAEGSNGQDPEECGTFYKLDDLLNDAKDILEEQRAGLEEDDDW